LCFQKRTLLNTIGLLKQILTFFEMVLLNPCIPHNLGSLKIQ